MSPEQISEPSASISAEADEAQACGARNSHCVCGLPAGHKTEAHLCTAATLTGRPCGGSWIVRGDGFDVVAFPDADLTALPLLGLGLLDDYWDDDGE
jgi:hypothetical protein